LKNQPGKKINWSRQN